MSERLSDEFLRQVEQCGIDMMDGVSMDLTTLTIRGAMIGAVLAELRSHRQSALTAEDREALAGLRHRLSGQPDYDEDCRVAEIAVLDKLLAAAGGGE
jgi:hypothetical protein